MFDLITFAADQAEGRSVSALLRAAFFGDWVGHCGTDRAGLIARGALIDVGSIAREAGFNCSIALSFGLHADLTAIPTGREHECYEGRLWDCLSVFRAAIRSRAGKGRLILFRFILTRTPFVDNEEDEFDNTADDGPLPHEYLVVAASGSGDSGEMVITLMTPGEGNAE